MQPCATTEQLVKFLHDQLEGPKRETISAHVEDCQACQQALDQLTRSPVTKGVRATDRNCNGGDSLIVALLKAKTPLFFEEELKEVKPSEPELPDRQAEGSAMDMNDVDRSARPPYSCPSITGFKIIREIGRGGMGVVYEAEEERLSRHVALKVLPASALPHPKQVERFRREAKAAARLHHTNIVPVFGVGDQAGHSYYVMQYIDGQGLDEVLKELRLLRQDGSSPRPGASLEPLESQAPPGGCEGHDVQGPPSVTAADVARSLVSGRFEEPGSPASDGQSTEAGESETTILAPPIVPANLSPVGASPVVLTGSSKLSSHSSFSRPYFQSVARIGLQVAEALEYANRQGVLHRDIKPSNLLLDTEGSALVTDFGLAKMADSDDLTDTGDIVGTLRYMAPERFQGQCDIRSDVYSLGLTLYELVALRPAFEASDRHELIEKVLHQEPERLNRLAPKVPRDVETIIQKAISREPERRYATAAALAEDLRRFLGGHTILGRRSSRAERAWRWCRRNPWVAASLVLLILGSTVSAWQAVRATWAERAARIAEATATTQRNRAESEAEIAKAVNDFLNKDVLAQASADSQASPDTKPDPDLKVRTALDRAAKRIEGKFTGKPLVEASIRRTIGETYQKLGLHTEALLHLERALELNRLVLGNENHETLETMHALGEHYGFMGKPDLAEPMLVAALEGMRRLRGADHPDTLGIMLDLGALYHNQGRPREADLLFTQSLKGLGNEDLKRVTALNNLAISYQAQGRLAEAEPLLAEATEVLLKVHGPEHSDTLTAINNLAQLYFLQGNLAEAERRLNEVLKVRNRVSGPDHPDTLGTKIDLAIVYQGQRRWAEAEPLLKDVIEGRRRTQGADHRDTLNAMSSLATFYHSQGQSSKAESLLVEAVERGRRAYGANNADTLWFMQNLGSLYSIEGRLTEATSLLTEAENGLRTALGADHTNTLQAMSNLASLYGGLGKPAEAEPLLSHILDVNRRNLGSEHSNTFWAMQNLAACYDRLGKHADAEKLFRESLEGRRKVLGLEDPTTLTSLDMLATCYANQKKYKLAEPLFVEALEGRRRVLGNETPETLGTMASLGRLRVQCGKSSEAEPLLRECLEVRKKTMPDNWLRFNTESLLGACLVGEKKYNEAERLLISSYQGLKDRENKLPPAPKQRVSEASERIVQLYDAWGNKEKAGEWRKKLSSPPSSPSPPAVPPKP